VARRARTVRPVTSGCGPDGPLVSVVRHDRAATIERAVTANARIETTEAVATALTRRPKNSGASRNLGDTSARCRPLPRWRKTLDSPRMRREGTRS
jgi:hypothetical protein